MLSNPTEHLYLTYLHLYVIHTLFIMIFIKFSNVNRFIFYLYNFNICKIYEYSKLCKAMRIRIHLSKISYFILLYKLYNLYNLYNLFILSFILSKDEQKKKERIKNKINDHLQSPLGDQYIPLLPPKKKKNLQTSPAFLQIEK